MIDRKSLPAPRVIDAIGCAVILAAAAAGYAVGIHPVLDARALVDRESSRLEAELLRAKETELAVKIAGDKLRALDEQLSDTVKLSPAAMLNDRISQLSTLATRHALGVEKFAPGDATRAGTSRFVAVPMMLGGMGSFAECAAFLSDLHHNQPDVRVTGLRMSSAGIGADGKPTPVTFGFDLVWYAAPDGFAGVETGR